jgi:hypothetical protein
MPFAGAGDGDGDGVATSHQDCFFRVHRFSHQLGSRYHPCECRDAVGKTGEGGYIKLYWKSCIMYPVHVRTRGQYLIVDSSHYDSN